MGAGFAAPLDELELDEPLVDELLELPPLDELELDVPLVDELLDPASLDEILEASLEEPEPDEFDSAAPVPEPQPATVIASATVKSHGIVRTGHSFFDRNAERSIAPIVVDLRQEVALKLRPDLPIRKSACAP
jgi:hypothetical protein